MQMKAHFLNVGDGDCTIIELPDNNISVVDLCNARLKTEAANAEFENPMLYLSKLNLSQEIFRYIQTHPELDHMDGLADLLRKFSITNFWDTENTRKKPSTFSAGFREEDWDKYEEFRQTEHVRYRLRSTTPVGLNGGTFPYDIYVISPSAELVKEANQNEDWNLLSYVVLIQYEGLKLLLGGDASDSAWQSIYDYAENDSSAKTLLSNITIFKASHHGRNSSYCGIDMLNLMNPKKIVISKGSVPGEQSAYGKYYNWSGGADNMFLTSKGTVILDYTDLQNKQYSIGYKK